MSRMKWKTVELFKSEVDNIVRTVRNIQIDVQMPRESIDEPIDWLSEEDADALSMFAAKAVVLIAELNAEVQRGVRRAQ